MRNKLYQQILDETPEETKIKCGFFDTVSMTIFSQIGR